MEYIQNFLSGLTLGDLIFFSILLVSGLFGWMRGFIKEIFSIAGWVAATFALALGFAPIQPITRDFIHNETAADFTTGLILFCGTLVIVSVVTHFISKWVKKSAASSADRSLGFLFGLARGYFIVCLAYLLYSAALPSLSDQHVWIRNAKTQPITSWGVEEIKDLVAKGDILEPAEPEKEELAEPTKEDANPDDSGYKKGIKDWPTPPEP